MSERRPTRISLPVTRLADAEPTTEVRALPAEVPVAVEIDGEPYAVMMLTPADLEDFAVGFALSEQLIARASDIARIDIREGTRGVAVDVRLEPAVSARLSARRRVIPGQSGCGLCGIMTLEEALPELAPLTNCPGISVGALARALEMLGAHQPLNAETGAVHAAAFCDDSGAVIAAREDVGRHNALDKVIGHLLRGGVDPQSGFVLLTSRCSYELVQKAVLARIPLLATISAPTELAVSLARAAKLTLIALARADSMLLFHDPFGRFAT